ncbi:MAG: ECF transporter S component [Clostridia bacterium]|nr:ECF transporter S component [Clostridia bacterium]
MQTNQKKLHDMVGTAILAAIVILLQVFVVIPLGAFSITLTLVPIIIGAIIYGARTGAFLGGVFGVTVAIQVVTGAMGVLSFMMFETRPVITLTLCVLKGVMAGLVSGLIYALCKKHRAAGVILSAISCPIVNTGIFVGGLFLFYYPLMSQFASENAFASTVSFIFVGIVGLNFVVEFIINVALIPVVLRLIKILIPKKA